EEDLLSQQELDQFTNDDGSLDEESLAALVDRLIERLIEEGYITVGDEQTNARPDSPSSRRGKTGKPVERSVKFEMTDKGLDFLGFKALKDLVGSLGKSSFGRHDTNHLSTGVEASEVSRRYEFGDTLNLDVSATLKSAIQREGLGVP